MGAYTKIPVGTWTSPMVGTLSTANIVQLNSRSPYMQEVPFMYQSLTGSHLQEGRFRGSSRACLEASRFSHSHCERIISISARIHTGRGVGDPIASTMGPNAPMKML